MNKLEKLEEQYKKLGEEIQALKKEEEFVPGWYMYWDDGMKERRVNWVKNKTVLSNTKVAWDHVEPVTQELLNQFLPKPKTRYDWEAILEKYPNAKYATTDEDGRVDLWETMPAVEKRLCKWLKQETDPTTRWLGGYINVGKTLDWEDSLEEKPIDN